MNYQVQVRFRISQHIRDQQLFYLLIEYFNCGRIENYSKSGTVNDFIFTGVKDINSIIIPFFSKHKIRGVKSKDFEDFSLIISLINQGLHLTEEGLYKIRQIKSRMNSSR